LTTKVCIDCGRIKCVEHEFYAKKDAKDGRSPYCKECQKKRSVAARERRYVREWLTREVEREFCVECRGRIAEEPFSPWCVECYDVIMARLRAPYLPPP
jgi:hypothetical protein